MLSHFVVRSKSCRKSKRGDPARNEREARTFVNTVRLRACRRVAGETPAGPVFHAVTV